MTSTERDHMLDIAYIAGAAMFFALMLRYVHACERLGHRSGEGDTHR
jgi:hypothetical protein